MALAVLFAGIAAPAGAEAPLRPGLEGTLWVGNRQWALLRPEVVAYDAASGQEVHSVQLTAAASDLATGKGKVFVGDEVNNRVLIIDGASGQVSGFVPTASKPHHFASSRGGNLIAYGAFGTNRVGVIDARSGEAVGEWPASANNAALVHAAAFSPDGNVVYTANDVAQEVSAIDIRSGHLLWTETVPKAHELIVSADGRRVYVSCRNDDKIRVLDLVEGTVSDLVSLPRPDTLQLSADGKRLTVGLRNGPKLAVVDLESATVATTIEVPGGTLAGHQWATAGTRSWLTRGPRLELP